MSLWDATTPVVIRRITSYFTVRAGEREYLCMPRARMKKERVAIAVGDRVVLEEVDETNLKATIAEVLPRANRLSRPAIANLDQAVIVFAADRPPFNATQLDRFLTVVGRSGIPAAIALNKADLVGRPQLEQMLAPYRELGYPVVAVSARQGDLGGLHELLAGRESVLAGPSGVGKSSLLNALAPGLELREAEVSARLHRGRHTTTFASLYPIPTPLGMALVADTPGYSHLDLGGLAPTELARLFPEMVPHLGDCRFPDCLHRGEPGCGVLAHATLVETRRASYLRMLEELEGIQARLSSTSLKDEGTVKRKAVAGGKEEQLMRLDTSQRQGSRRMVKQRLATMVDEDLEGDPPEADDEP